MTRFFGLGLVLRLKSAGVEQFLPLFCQFMAVLAADNRFCFNMTADTAQVVSSFQSGLVDMIQVRIFKFSKVGRTKSLLFMAVPT